jgi:hypothetical protein
MYAVHGSGENGAHFTFQYLASVQPYQPSTRYKLSIVHKDFDQSTIDKTIIRPSSYQPTVDRGESVVDS